MNETIESDNLPIPRASLVDMVRVYNECRDTIGKSFAALNAVVKQFAEVYPGGYFRLQEDDLRGYGDDEPSKATLASLKKQAWRSLIEKMELRRVLSIKRNNELSQQLETGKDLPDITEANILGMLETNLGNVKQFAEEAVAEVFDWLRPSRGRLAELKTNTQFEIGRRAIIGYAVESQWGNTGFRTSYHIDAKLMALDNVFHTLDGKGGLRTHSGPLIDAINSTKSDGLGETAYFKFKCCHNRNLHVEFKRLDLLERFNVIAGGNRLRAPKEEAACA